MQVIEISLSKVQGRETNHLIMAVLSKQANLIRLCIYHCLQKLKVIRLQQVVEGTRVNLKEQVLQYFKKWDAQQKENWDILLHLCLFY